VRRFNRNSKWFTGYSTLSLWDTFRAEHPLLTLIAPDVPSDITNTMLEYYQTKKRYLQCGRSMQTKQIQ
jgi:putative alpha-1,2-mannosidase